MIRLPLSTSSHHKSLLLRSDDQFCGPTGRWAVRWDDEYGTISNSMRPPPLKEVAASDEILTVEKPLREMEAGEMASQGRSSEVTFSPTPPPNDDPGKEKDQMPTSLMPNEALYEETSTGTSDEEHQYEMDIPEEDGAGLAVSQIPNKVLVSEPRSPSTQDIIQPRRRSIEKATNEPCISPSLGSSVSAPTGTEEGIQGPPSSPDRSAEKRKVLEIEAAGEDIEVGDAEAPVSEEESSADTIVVKPIQIPEEARRTQGSAEEVEALRPRKRVRSSSADNIGPSPIVIFSGNTLIEGRKNTMATFERLGGRVTRSINEASILCIGEGPLRKTGKLIMAVAMGIDIVTERWIIDTHRFECFPRPGEYLPIDGSRERQWNFSLREAIARGKKGLTHLLAGTTVVLTQQIRKDLGSLERDVSRIATILGADAVKNRLPALKDRHKYNENQLLIIGVQGDPQAAQVGRLGQKLFNKDILTMAALRGKVDRESAEFTIDVPVKEEDQA